MSAITTPTKPANAAARVAGAAANAADERYHPAGGMRQQLNKVFPTHWSFLLGEIALYSFIVLLLSGTYLTLFFDPSMAEVTYDGLVRQPARRPDVPGLRVDAGHLLRGARRPVRPPGPPLGGAAVHGARSSCTCSASSSPARSAGRVRPTGSSARCCSSSAMFEGFFGYSLPDDLLSGTGLRVASGITLISIPVIGTWIHWALFGGEFPGTEIIPRLYTAAHPADPGHHPGADRACTWPGLVPEAHPVPRPRPHGDATSSACASCRCSRSRAARSSP